MNSGKFVHNITLFTCRYDFPLLIFKTRKSTQKMKNILTIYVNKTLFGATGFRWGIL